MNNTEIQILYVEDDLLNQMVLKSTLKALGYENVLIAGDAKQAFEILENPNIELDFILMDIGLPEMNGIELTEKIRHSDLPAKEIPIVAVTGNEASNAKELCLAAGMNDFLMKPVEAKLLKTTIETILLSKK